MSGLPGSGKSTYARNLPNPKVICSADHYFEEPDGRYIWRPSAIGKAHAKCQGRFLYYLSSAVFVGIIVVDNTNLSVRDMSFYVEECEKANIPFLVTRVLCDPGVAFARQAHNVPMPTFSKMVDKERGLVIPPSWPSITVKN